MKKSYSSTTKNYSSTTSYYFILVCTTPVPLQYYSVQLRTTKYYSVIQSTTPVLLCTTQYFFQHYAVVFHYDPSTTLFLLCTTSIPSYSTNQNNQPASQPASQFGRPAGEHGTGRPAGTHGSGRPADRETAGRPAGDEIANRSPVLSHWGSTTKKPSPGKPVAVNFHQLYSETCNPVAKKKWYTRFSRQEFFHC